MQSDNPGDASCGEFLRNKAIVKAIVEVTSVAETARVYGVSRHWAHELKRHWDEHGVAFPDPEIAGREQARRDGEERLRAERERPAAVRVRPGRSPQGRRARLRLLERRRAAAQRQHRQGERGQGRGTGCGPRHDHRHRPGHRGDPRRSGA